MRLSALDGRAVVCTGSGHVDIETESGGRFPASVNDVLERWEDVDEWANQFPAAPTEFGTGQVPVSNPRQIFAIGLNYIDHASETGMGVPTAPVVFTKFASSLAGPDVDVKLPDGSVDWEVELVVAVGRGGRNIPESEAWERMAGVMVGQDLSERRAQLAGPAPQFSLAKSHAGFAPIGPAVVTLNELADRDSIQLWCDIDGERVQEGSTSDMVFSVPELVARLSSVVALLPGDLIFTGTPPGVGMGRSPERYLQPGQTLTSGALGVGTLRQRLV
jgi:2,4-diketo-3-deoxy-L-fuconate hydrolase